MFIARLISLAINLYILGLIVYSLLSWVRSPGSYSLRSRMAPYYEPLLGPIRGVLGRINLGGLQIDLSPIVLIILLSIAGNIMLRLMVPPF